MEAMAKKSTTPALWRHPLLWAWRGWAVVFLISHLWRLTSLPVFADEAIYIRWTQLIMDDWQRYLFFPLNDGKTPLFIWLLTPWQYLFSDQLWAARFVAVLVGVIQVGASLRLVKTLGGRRWALFLVGLWTVVLPFWFLHHRLALIDGLLTLWLTLFTEQVVKVLHASQPTSKSARHTPWLAAGLGAVALGAALWTKVPAVLGIPTVGVAWLLLAENGQQRRRSFVPLAAMVVGGVALFAGLRISPAFGQLFSRGSDFLYPWQQVVLQGQWTGTIRNWPTYLWYFLSYFGWPVMAVLVAGLFSPTRKHSLHFLFWSGLAFAFPIALLGKVVYPRYFLPVALYWTAAAALSAEDLIERWVEQAQNLHQRLITGLLTAMILGQSIATSGVFMAYAIWQPNQTPFVSSDRSQYLEDWSSGHGIIETAHLIQGYQQQGTVAVATEGFFGTLPDGLLLYFHDRNVEGVYIEGIGQPVYTLPASFIARAKNYDRILLVVNSHRLHWQLPTNQLVAEFCRPNQQPCLQVWDIKPQVQLAD